MACNALDILRTKGWSENIDKNTLKARPPPPPPTHPLATSFLLDGIRLRRKYGKPF